MFFLITNRTKNITPGCGKVTKSFMALYETNHSGWPKLPKNLLFLMINFGWKPFLIKDEVIKIILNITPCGMRIKN